MGVKHLIDVVRRLYPAGVRETPVAVLRGRRVAVDASWLIYQSTLAISRGAARAGFKNAGGRDVTHLIGVLNKLTFFRRIGLLPVMVFDGAPPAIKEAALEERRRARRKYIGEDLITREAVAEVLDMVRLFGVPYVQAEGEADPVLAGLQRKGLVDCVLTEDTDILVYGATCLLHRLKSTSAVCEEICLPPDCQETLICLSVLLGCDYFPRGVPGIGKKRAFELITTGKAAEVIAEAGHAPMHDTLRRLYGAGGGDRGGPVVVYPPLGAAGELRTFLSDHLALPERRVVTVLRALGAA